MGYIDERSGPMIERKNLLLPLQVRINVLQCFMLYYVETQYVSVISFINDVFVVRDRVLSATTHPMRSCLQDSCVLVTALLGHPITQDLLYQECPPL